MGRDGADESRWLIAHRQDKDCYNILHTINTVQYARARQQRSSLNRFLLEVIIPT